VKPGELRRITRGGVGLPNQEYWENDESWSTLPKAHLGDLVVVIRYDAVYDADWVRVLHPVHGVRDVGRDDLEAVQPDR
jgi:hypothetical protein